ncbi:MAG: hypothetical protein JSS10_04325 [Verrucomicrobia bacterium]|nr:hypothetical protein [Verrucomicrobiota bacterium]
MALRFLNVLSLGFPFFTGILSLLQSHLLALNPSVFQQKLQESTPLWMKEQIERDLAPFRKELSQKFLDSLFTKEEFYLFRVQVKDGKLTVQKSISVEGHPVPAMVIPHLQQLHALKPLPDLDILFTAHDTFYPCQTKGPAWPIFIITKSKHDPGLILFPDWFALNDFEPDRAKILQGNDMYPWGCKINRLFFRGKDTGVHEDYARWKDYPRPRLVALSAKYPKLIDAKFNDLFYTPMLKKAKKEGWMGKFVSTKHFPRYRYLMDIDGNCAATPRFPLLLHSNSVILKSITDSIQWFYPKIKPYVHFIPVKEDLSDLLSQLEWAKNHHHECQIISQNARQLAEEVLSHEAIFLYLYRLLEEYSKRQQQYYLEL